MSVIRLDKKGLRRLIETELQRKLLNEDDAEDTALQDKLEYLQSLTDVHVGGDTLAGDIEYEDQAGELEGLYSLVDDVNRALKEDPVSFKKIDQIFDSIDNDFFSKEDIISDNIKDQLAGLARNVENYRQSVGVEGDLPVATPEIEADDSDVVVDGPYKYTVDDDKTTILIIQTKKKGDISANPIKIGPKSKYYKFIAPKMGDLLKKSEAKPEAPEEEPLADAGSTAPPAGLPGASVPVKPPLEEGLSRGSLYRLRYRKIY